MKAKNRAEESVREHKAILEAIRNRDADQAEKLADEHIRHVIANLEHRPGRTPKEEENE